MIATGTSDVCTDRIEIAAACSDCDLLPKVAGAGETFGEHGEYQRMHNGLVIHKGAYHGEWMTEITRRLRGHHEPQEEKVFAAVLDHLPESATMLELGSFWAYYSMWFHQRVTRPRCILVEPIAQKLAAGEEHFRLNKLEGSFVHAFVGRHSRRDAEFLDWDGSRLRLPMVSVDGLMQQWAVETIDVLHADVQGAEFDMLLGAERALTSRRVGYVFVSTHGCEHRRCLDRLTRLGYEIIAAHTVLESFSGDGLIAARSPDRPEPRQVAISRRRTSLSQRWRFGLACFKQHLSRRRDRMHLTRGAEGANPNT